MGLIVLRGPLTVDLVGVLVWFEECVGGTSRRQLGLVQSPDKSFRLADDDTITSVTALTGRPARRPARRSPTCRWTRS